MPALHHDTIEAEYDTYEAEFEIEPHAPAEGDLLTDDHVHFYLDGKLAFTVGEDEDLADAIHDWMNAEGWFPDVWWISDHGNAHLISL